MVHCALSLKHIKKIAFMTANMGIPAYCFLYHLNKTILCLRFLKKKKKTPSNSITILFGHEIWLHSQQQKRKNVKRKQSIHENCKQPQPHNGIGNGSNKVTESQRNKDKIRKWKWEKMFCLWSLINSKTEPEQCFSFSFSSSSSGSTSTKDEYDKILYKEIWNTHAHD